MEWRASLARPKLSSIAMCVRAASNRAGVSSARRDIAPRSCRGSSARCSAKVVQYRVDRTVDRTTWTRGGFVRAARLYGQATEVDGVPKSLSMVATENEARALVARHPRTLFSNSLALGSTASLARRIFPSRVARPGWRKRLWREEGVRVRDRAKNERGTHSKE